MKIIALILLASCYAPDPPAPPIVYAPSFKCTSVPGYARACAPSTDAASITVGTVDGATFTPFSSDGTNALPVHPGPQGGYHAFLNVHAQGLCPNWNLATMRIKQPGATSILRLQQFELGMLALTGEPGFETGDLQVFICPSQLRGLALNGATLELEVSVVDCTSPKADGTPLITQTFTVVPTCPPGDKLCSDDARGGCAAL